MGTWLRLHIWQLALATLGLVVLVVGFLATQSEPTEASAGLPADQQIYWSWVGSINQGAASSLDAGLDLLDRFPHLEALYLRLAEVCRSSDAVAVCRDALQNAAPPDTTTHLYREASLALLLSDTAQAAVDRWHNLARREALDPTLARLIVDEAAQSRDTSRLADVEAIWHRVLATDTMRAGAAFGLGYAAGRRSDWSVAEPLLRRVTRLAPNDPHAYRELGRIYYFTSQPDKFEAALAAGIEAAEARHDLEQALILRGNLGWNLVVRSSDLEQAETLLEQALEQSRMLADEETEGFNYYRLASVYVKQDRYDEAFALLDSADVRYARHAPRQHAEVRVLRGTALGRIFRFSDAEQELEAAIAEAEEHRNVGAKIQALVNLCSLRRKMSRYEAAREAGLEALALAQRYRTRAYEVAARILLGVIEKRGGHYEVAQAHYEAALEMAQQAEDTASVEELYLRLGSLALDVGDAPAAEDHFDALLDRAGEVGHGHLARTYRGLAAAYQRYGNDTEALRYMDLALAQMEPGKHEHTRLRMQLTKALLLIMAGAYDEAEALLDDIERTASKDPLWQFRIELRRGHVSRLQKQYADALQHYEKAAAYEQQHLDTKGRLNVLYGQALAHWHLGHRDRAEAAFKQAIAVVEALRGNLDSARERSFFVQNKVEIYEHFAAFLEQEGRSDEALHYTERARSRGLVDLLYTMQVGQQVDPQQPTGRVLELGLRVRALAQVLVDEPFGETIGEDAYNEAGLARLRREYVRTDSLYQQARVELSPEERLYTFDPITPDSTQALLAEGEAMIVYDLRTIEAPQHAADSAASVAYVVLADTVVARPLDVQPDALAETVRFFRSQIGSSAGGPGTDWEPAAQRLYQDLVAPVLPVLPASVRHLHLMPEGVLHYVPFAALLSPDGQFLVERYTLSVAPSASSLKLSRARNPRRWRSILLLADPHGRLPGTRREAQAIQRQHPDDRQLLLGEDATQVRLEERASHFDILHLATHGRFVSRAPWQSHLELHDDVLSVEEIGQLDLDAYLVTLSACETALSGGLLSDVPNGDEWVGLNQAFLVAGTPTVLASLWPIDDTVSSSFMIHFYDALGPAGKAHALAQTQRRFLHESHTRHPFYWAPFTVIGDPL